MHKSAFRDLLILIVLGGLLFLGGYFLVRNVGFNSDSFTYDFSTEQEVKLGELMKETLWDNFKKCKSQAADSAIRQITDRLLDALDSSSYQYQFRIIQSDEVNAFTIPGGNIFIFSGLIELSETPEEVAAVLAHEIGHAEQRHVVKKIVKEFSLAVVVSILAGGDPGLILQILQQVVGSSFDRDQEDEADEFALRLLENAGVDPRHLATFFERLNSEDLSYNKNLELVMTHPHNDSRIEKAKAYRTRKDFQSMPFNLDWKQVQEAVIRNAGGI